MRFLRQFLRALTPGVLIFFIMFGAVAGAAEQGKTFPMLSPDGLVDLITKDGSGRVSIITVFASWCPPCQKEFPMLVQMRGEYAEEQLLIAGISSDESMAELQKFVDRHQVNFPVYSGTGPLFMLMGVEAIPHMFIFNKKGELAQSIVGLIPEARLKRMLSELMSE